MDKLYNTVSSRASSSCSYPNVLWEYRPSKITSSTELTSVPYNADSPFWDCRPSNNFALMITQFLISFIRLSYFHAVCSDVFQHKFCGVHPHQFPYSWNFQAALIAPMPWAWTIFVPSSSTKWCSKRFCQNQSRDFVVVHVLFRLRKYFHHCPTHLHFLGWGQHFR